MSPSKLSESPSCLSFTPSTLLRLFHTDLSETAEGVAHFWGNCGVCQSLSYHPSFSLPRRFQESSDSLLNAVQHHDCASVLSKLPLPSPAPPVECFYAFPTRWPLLLLPDLTWNTNFPSFLALEASSFCYLTLQLYHLTHQDQHVACLKSWKLILLLQTPPRLAIVLALRYHYLSR